MMNNYLFLYIFIFTSLGVYGNDSLLVDKKWTEKRTIYVNKEEIDSIGDALKGTPSNSAELLERHAALLASLESSGWYRREALAEFMKTEFPA